MAVFQVPDDSDDEFENEQHVAQHSIVLDQTNAKIKNWVYGIISSMAEIQFVKHIRELWRNEVNSPDTSLSDIRDFFLAIWRVICVILRLCFLVDIVSMEELERRAKVKQERIEMMSRLVLNDKEEELYKIIRDDMYNSLFVEHNSRSIGDFMAVWNQILDRVPMSLHARLNEDMQAVLEYIIAYGVWRNGMIIDPFPDGHVENFNRLVSNITTEMKKHVRAEYNTPSGSRPTLPKTLSALEY